MNSVGLVSAPQDVGVADYLSNDLARQGVPVSRDPVPDGPLVLVVGPSSADDPRLQAAAEEAARRGQPIHVVRLGEGHYDWPALRQAASWTDAHGAAAQANVAALAMRLRGIAPSAPPASPWGAPPPPPSPWAGSPPAGMGHPAPARPPATPAGRTEPSDRGSLIALGVISGLGLILLILYLAGALNFGARAPVAGTPAAPTYGPQATPAPAGGAVTDQWLTGTWKENCASNEFIRFDMARGTATLHNGAGRVTRSGNRLTITGGGGSIAMTVAYLAQDRMSATAQGGTQTLYRCG
mgnify:CR=1 FL=1